MKTALITGASTGIGRQTAKSLSREGWHVVAAVRQESELAEVEELGANVGSVRMDVTDPESIAAARAQIEGRISALVNNAGIAVPGPLEVLPLDQFREQLEVNLVGQLAVTQAFLADLRETRGRLIFLSSLAGKAAFPFTGAYNAAKFGLEGMVDALRQELRDDSIGVSLIEPGIVKTPIWEKAAARAGALRHSLDGQMSERYAESLGRYEKRLRKAPEKGMEPEAVADTILKALSAERPNTRYPVGTGAKALYRVRPLIPDRVYDALLARYT
jgi:NAD(P)-dependent dehydrogenase (short-subunit alcohol dehydrogenase family)